MNSFFMFKKSFFIKLVFSIILCSFISFVCMSERNTSYAKMSDSLKSSVKSLAKSHAVDKRKSVRIFSRAFDELDREIYDANRGIMYDAIKRDAVSKWFEVNSSLMRESSDEVILKNVKSFLLCKYDNFRKYWIEIISRYFREGRGIEVYKEAQKMVRVAESQSKCTTFVLNMEIFYSKLIEQLCLVFSEDFMMVMSNSQSDNISVLASMNYFDQILGCFAALGPVEWYDFSKVSEKVSDSHEFAERFKDCASRVKAYVSNEPALSTAPKGDALVIGDLHGNIYSANAFISKARMALEENKVQSVVFLGDYVDRGFFSLEVLYSVFQLKLQFPEKVFLIRGNHEMRGVQPATFQLELKSRFSDKDAFDIDILLFDDLFSSLPLAVELTRTDDKKVLCVHGGIPCPDEESFSLFNSMRENNAFALAHWTSFCDCFAGERKLFYNILWNDPDYGEKISAPDRGMLRFTKAQLDLFLEKMGYEYLVRGHEFVTDIFKIFDGKCCTVFSSHNYSGSNDAHMAIVTEKGLSDYMVIKSDGSIVEVGV